MKYTNKEKIYHLNNPSVKLKKGLVFLVKKSKICHELFPKASKDIFPIAYPFEVNYSFFKYFSVFWSN